MHVQLFTPLSTEYTSVEKVYVPFGLSTAPCTVLQSYTCVAIGQALSQKKDAVPFPFL